MRTLLLATLLVLVGCTPAPAHQARSSPLVLRGVTVIDGTGAPPHANMDVVIEGERIAAIHPSGSQRHARCATVLDLGLSVR